MKKSAGKPLDPPSHEKLRKHGYVFSRVCAGPDGLRIAIFDSVYRGREGSRRPATAEDLDAAAGPQKQSQTATPQTSVPAIAS